MVNVKRLTIWQVYMTKHQTESRTAKAVLVKLTPTDRKLLQKAAKKHRIPMSTLAYEIIRERLQHEFAEEGAA